MTPGLYSSKVADALVAKWRDNKPGLAGRAQASHASPHPAVRLILFCESSLGVGRMSFRAAMVEAVKESRPAGADYFLRYENVFRDWIYGERSMPPWASAIACDIGRALLRAGWVAKREKDQLRKILSALVTDLAGGSDALAWLQTALDEIGMRVGPKSTH